MRLTSLWYFLSATILFALFKLLFDNILYAAIMARLRTSFGIEERDVIAIVAANLVPIVATIVALVAIYFLTLQHHATKTKTVNGPLVAQAPTATNVGKRFFNQIARFEPLPAVTLGLAVALAGGIYWQIHYGPNREVSRKPFSADELKFRLEGLDDILTALNYIRQGAINGRDLLENWQYQIQTNGPDAFMISVGNIYSYFTGIGDLGLSNAYKKFQNYPEIRDLAKLDSPDCAGITLAFYSELKRIKDHKGADMVFTLINNMKLADWRAVLPECDKWAIEKIQIVRKKRAEYIGN